MKKRSTLFLAYVTSIAIVSRAQTGPTNAQPVPHPPPATQKAINQLEAMQERLVDLSQEQVISLNSVLLDRNIALDSLRDHPSGNPKADDSVRRTIWHDTDVRIYALLWDNQQLQYVLWKQEQRIKNLEKQRQQLQATIDSTAAHRAQ